MGAADAYRRTLGAGRSMDTYTPVARLKCYGQVVVTHRVSQSVPGSVEQGYSTTVLVLLVSVSATIAFSVAQPSTAGLLAVAALARVPQ